MIDLIVLECPMGFSFSFLFPFSLSCYFVLDLDSPFLLVSDVFGTGRNAVVRWPRSRPWLEIRPYHSSALSDWTPVVDGSRFGR